MKVALVFLFVFLIFQFGFEKAYSQNSSERILQVRFAPLNLFDPITGVIQVGLEKRFTNRLALSADYGLRFNKVSISARDSDRLNYRYYKAKAQIKYIFKTDPARRDIFSTPYLAIEAFYFPQQYSKKRGYLLKDQRSYQYEQSDINRTAKTLALLVGDEKIYKHLTLDYFIGAGIRWLYISHKTQGEVETPRPSPIDIGRFDPIDEHQGIFLRPHISLGLKIGYILLRK